MPVANCKTCIVTCRKRSVRQRDFTSVNKINSNKFLIISDTLVWEEITTGGSVPSRRLNFSLVLVELSHKFEKTHEQSHGDSNVEEKDSETKGETAFKISADETETYVPHILLHGGMDEKGNMYDDFYVMSLGSGNDDVLG
jgi:hypothetical protein